MERLMFIHWFQRRFPLRRTPHGNQWRGQILVSIRYAGRDPSLQLSSAFERFPDHTLLSTPLCFMLYNIVFHKDFRIFFRAHSNSPLSPAHIWGLLHLPSSRLHPSHPPFLPPIPTTPTISNHKLTTTLSPWTPYRVKFSSSP